MEGFQQDSLQGNNTLDGTRESDTGKDLTSIIFSYPVSDLIDLDDNEVNVQAFDELYNKLVLAPAQVEAANQSLGSQAVEGVQEMQTLMDVSAELVGAGNNFPTNQPISIEEARARFEDIMSLIEPTQSASDQSVPSVTTENVQNLEGQLIFAIENLKTRLQNATPESKGDNAVEMPEDGRGKNAVIPEKRRSKRPNLATTASQKCRKSRSRSSKIVSKEEWIRNKTKGPQCTICEYENENLRLFKKHYYTHLGEYVQCSRCTLRFANKENVRRHELLKHRRDVLSCQACGTVLSNIREKNRHLKNVHTPFGLLTQNAATD